MTKLENKKYDLEERTGRFGEAIIDFCLTSRQDNITRQILSQLVRSGTSVGANYREANGASSKKDFQNKIYICKKESKETIHWLRMIYRCFPEHKEQISELSIECQELILIFSAIGHSLKNKEKSNKNYKI